MKITRKQLRQIIKEELSIISEGPGEGNTIRFEFERGKSDIDEYFVDGDVNATIDNLVLAVNNAHSGAKPIIVRAGTSGSGTDAQNKVVRDRRINAAFEYLGNLAKDLNIGHSTPGEFEEGFGPSLDPASLWNLSNVQNVISKIKPGQSIEDPDRPGVIRTASKDADSPWYGEKQFVEITIKDPGMKADTVTLASKFVEATLRTTGPVYADTPAGQLKVSNAVADILSQLRNADEFEAFNDTVVKLNPDSKDFYAIAATATLNIPSWVPKLGGTSFGPKEIPAGVAEINSQLKRLGQEPLV